MLVSLCTSVAPGELNAYQGSAVFVPKAVYASFSVIELNTM